MNTTQIYVRYGDQINEYVPISRLAALERERDEALKWKAAVQNAAVVSWTLSAENENDPTKAVNDLLCWTQQVALDPAVSAEAKSWRDRNAALVEAVEGLVASANDMMRYGSMTQVAAWDRLDAALARAEAAVKGAKGADNGS